MNDDQLFLSASASAFIIFPLQLRARSCSVDTQVVHFYVGRDSVHTRVYTESQYTNKKTLH